MEVLQRRAVAVGRSADLVQRDEAAVAVEESVLDGLGHDRPAGLLKAGDEGQHVAPVERLFDLEQQQAEDEVDRCRLAYRGAGARGGLLPDRQEERGRPHRGTVTTGT